MISKPTTPTPKAARASKRASAKGAKGPRAVKRRSPFSAIEEAVAAIRAGGMIVVVDDEERENEGDLTMAAERVTPEAVNFMITHARGMLCLSMTPERLDALDIPLVVNDNSSRRGTPMCVPIDARQVATGVSAPERAQTIKVADIIDNTKSIVRRDPGFAEVYLKEKAALLEVLRVIREEEPPRPSTRMSTIDKLASIAAQRGLELRFEIGRIQRIRAQSHVMRPGSIRIVLVFQIGRAHV